KRALVAGAFSTGVHAKRLPLLALCISSALAAPAIAQAQPAARVQFNIPAQPLDAALRRFSEQSRQQVLFSESAVAGRRAPVLTGSYTPQEALA
ncbi:STN domain-containing protein, partial [Escherichia coli]